MREEVKKVYDSLKVFDDDYLIKLTTIQKFNYTNVYIETAKIVLKNRKIEIDFDNIDFFIELFVNSYNLGWQKELRNMFSELIINGWNLNIPIKSKEKYGNFVCDIETSNISLKEIINKYIKIIDSLCSKCGSDKNVFSDQTTYWIENICDKCWINKIENRYTISEISKEGFKYFLLINDKLEPKYFEWNQVKNINLTIPKYGSKHELEINIDFENLYLDSKIDINFFNLLKFIPKEKISPKNYDYISNLFINLKSCPICGKIAVHNGICLVCQNSLNEILNSRILNWKRFNNIEKIIEDEQNNFQNSIKHYINTRYRFENDISFDNDLSFKNMVSRN